MDKSCIIGGSAPITLKMLDWLSNEQRASYNEVSQILDAPETPAPLFAYRALKSVLFGSYDGGESDDDDKENAPLQTRSGEKSTGQEIAHQKPEILTPARPTPRRRLSPAKSILRTPGIPTPRRQNPSVKFKEIKQTTTNLGTITEARVTKEKAVAQQPKELAVKSVKCQTPEEGKTVATAEAHTPDSKSGPETHYNLKEIDVFIAATEHEMKKLVRYGQRMRDYARLSQKENASLKRELEKVRTENETLRSRGQSAISQEKKGQGAESAGLFDLSSSKAEPVAAGQKHFQSKSKPTDRAATGQAQQQLRLANDRQPLKRHPSPKLIQSKSEDITAAVKTDMKASIQPAPPSNPRWTGNPRVASRTQLPPDKLEAAKARLRLKSEERRKALGMAGQAEKEYHVSSVVDWQNL